MNRSLAAEMLAEVRKAAALQLWELGAIKVDLVKPFRLTSGNYSPLYVNCRQLISSPSFIDLFCASARWLCGNLKVRFDVVAGGETAGIPFAAFLARGFGQPMIYVRKEVKSHGLGSRIEGVLSSGSRVLLVEDLITDAGSKLSFIEAIGSGGGIVEDVLVIFDRLQGGREALGKVGIRLHAVTDLDIALGVSEEAQLLSPEETKAVRDYLEAPERWHQSRGLSYRG
jgi:orotate phosphoribosyltransferase